MASNPLIAQGTLNRLRSSFICPTFPSLNVTAAFLGKGGITLSLEGEATAFIDTLTGGVQSPQPYMGCMIVLNLIKAQSLANTYKQQMESISNIGDCNVKGDSSVLGDYSISNCSLQTVRELPFNGEDAGYVVTVRGYYAVNNQLWELT